MLNELAKKIHDAALAKGWHTPPPAIDTHLMNIHSEVSELWEAYRENRLHSPCNKAEKMEEPLTCIEEELSDIVIRALDVAQAKGIDVDRAVRVKMAYNATRAHRHGGKLA